MAKVPMVALMRFQYSKHKQPLDLNDEFDAEDERDAYALRITGRAKLKEEDRALQSTSNQTLTLKRRYTRKDILSAPAAAVMDQPTEMAAAISSETE